MNINIKYNLKSFFRKVQYLFREKIFKRVYNKRLAFLLYDELDSAIEKRLTYFFEKQLVVVKLKASVIYLEILNFLPNIKLYFVKNANIETKVRKYSGFKNVSPFSNPMDAWEYHIILSKCFKADLDSSKLLFNEVVDKKKLSKKDKVYVLGTGPSLEKAIQFDFSSGYIVVCNTIVKDKLLWNYLNPDFFVAGDALYHFSDSSFARKFREDLVERMSETPDTYFVYPAIFDAFIKTKLSSLSNRCIPIPIGAHKNILVDLRNDFFLPSKGNVLNLLLFPLASTLSRNINLWGFDGRKKSELNIFWENSNQHFYNDLILEQREEHPAFYAHFIPPGNESKYVNNVHGDELENDLTYGESIGYKIKMMHESYTPSLQKRYIDD